MDVNFNVKRVYLLMYYNPEFPCEQNSIGVVTWASVIDVSVAKCRIVNPDRERAPTKKHKCYNNCKNKCSTVKRGDFDLM